MGRVVDLNGRLLSAAEARVSTMDLGVLYGIGLFETMRAYGGRVFRLREHLERLLASAETLKLPITREMLPDQKRFSALLSANDLTDARLRLTVSGGSPSASGSPGAGGSPGHSGVEHMVLATAVEVQPLPEEYYTRGITVTVCSQTQLTTNPLAGHKTTCFWNRLRALHEAQLHGCGEALWFTEKRELAEGSISNVFIVKDGVVKTPPLGTPVLPGVTRAAVIELCEQHSIPCQQTTLTIDDLLDADEAFICNSIMEIVPICRVERKAVGDEKVGGITKQLTDAYQVLVRNNS